MSSVADLKAEGNKAFAAKDYDSAIESYTKGIELAQANGDKETIHVLYSNRSACYAGLKKYEAALADAELTIQANPSFAKGWGRKAGALHGAHRLEEAVTAYEEGLKLAPSDAALQKGLESVKRSLESGPGSDGPTDSIGRLFSDPSTLAKLAANPKTSSFLADPSFVQKLKQMQGNPQEAMGAFQDPRILTCMGVLMGVDLQAFERPEGSDELPADLENKREDIEAQTKAQGQPARPSQPAASPSSQEKADPAPEAEMEDASEDQEDKKAKTAAEAEKKQGNDKYVKKDFVPAIAHYQKAWELYPKDITFLNNLAACYFEQGEYDEAIKTCEKAIEEGRGFRADYKHIAKAFGRIGSAYLKKDDLEHAIANFEKSLTEHRTPDILNKLRETEKLQKDRARQAYIDPAKAEEERNKGNDLYKKGDFPGSVQAYSESIKRNPNDPRGYTNRASAYTKLAALPEALKDAEEAIKIDPKFVKGYIRKANVLFSMKDFNKALLAVQQASDIDDEQAGGAGKGPHAREIATLQEKCFEAMYTQRAGESDEETLQRAMRDPEIAKIMQDPVMQSILQQAQSNPAALQDHMKNPTIRANVQKLIAAGIIKTR